MHFLQNIFIWSNRVLFFFIYFVRDDFFFLFFFVRDDFEKEMV